jgi:DNA replication regulator DPB11
LRVEGLTHPLEFHNLKITSTSFSTMEMLHASKMINLLGATYDQYLGPHVAVLVCGSNKLNLDKIAFAKDKGIPSVNSLWLWACVDEARLVDVKKYSMPHRQHELRSASSRNPGSHDATATLKAPSHASPKVQVHGRYDDDRSGLIDECTANSIRSSGGKPQTKQKAIPPRPTALPHKSSDHSPEPRRHHKPLEEVSLPRLNSPRKSQLTPPIHAATDPDSATSGNATSALAVMLEAKRASRTIPGSGSLPPGRDSDAENPQLRRKRTLGRAASSGSDSLVRGDDGASKVGPLWGPANGTAMRSEESLLLSQKLIYEDPEMRERREKLLAEIGGAKDTEVERAAAVVTPAAKTRGGRSKRKRR